MFPTRGNRSWLDCLTSGLAPLLAAGVLVLCAAPAAAQSGQIAGTVTDSNGQPLQNVEVTVVGTRLGTLTDASGAFELASVPAGPQEVSVEGVGYQTATRSVTVDAGQTARMSVELEAAPYQLGDLVVSASRGVERVTDAPATITKVGEEAIDESVGNSFMGALKAVKGLNYIQTGITSASINARGFHSSFNNRMLMVEDGRLAIQPENGLPVLTFTTMPKIDLASVEVVTGPGSALYGANASNGVVRLESKDPREYPGTEIELEGGTRDRLGVQFRHAGVTGEDEQFGYKITGEWQQVDEFSNRLSVAIGDTTIPEAEVDWKSEVYRAQGEVSYYGDDVDVTLSGGINYTWGVGQTNVGRNQFNPWNYNFQQVELESDHWNVTFYRTHSDPKESYAVDQYTENQYAYPDMTDEEIEDISGWPGFGELWVGEAEGNYTLPWLLSTEVTFGARYRRDVVSSDREWLTDRQTGENITIGQPGGFLQTRTPLVPRLDLLLAARVDGHEDFSTQFSPKAGLLYEAAENHTLRATFNRAYKPPTTLQRHFYIPDFVPGVAVLGNRNGFSVRDAAGSTVADIEPLTPETNNTFELGYRGLIGERMLLDVTGWYGMYEEFLGTLRPINDPTSGLFAYDHEGNRIESQGGTPVFVFTYQNLGSADLLGLDGSARVFVTPDVMLRGTLSILDAATLEEPETDPEATSLNAPTVKWNLGGDFENLFGGDAFAGFLLRSVSGYDYVSGINVGKIPTFNTLNAHVGLDIPGSDLTARLSAQNLFTCRTVTENDPITPQATAGSRKCGFDEPHIEMINMPAQELSAVVTLRYHLD